MRLVLIPAMALLLIAEMRKAIDRSDAFIASMQ